MFTLLFLPLLISYISCENFEDLKVERNKKYEKEYVLKKGEIKCFKIIGWEEYNIVLTSENQLKLANNVTNLQNHRYIFIGNYPTKLNYTKEATFCITVRDENVQSNKLKITVADWHNKELKAKYAFAFLGNIIGALLIASITGFSKKSKREEYSNMNEKENIENSLQMQDLMM